MAASAHTNLLDFLSAPRSLGEVMEHGGMSEARAYRVVNSLIEAGLARRVRTTRPRARYDLIRSDLADGLLGAEEPTPDADAILARIPCTGAASLPEFGPLDGTEGPLRLLERLGLVVAHSLSGRVFIALTEAGRARQAQLPPAERVQAVSVDRGRATLCVLLVLGALGEVHRRHLAAILAARFPGGRTLERALRKLTVRGHLERVRASPAGRVLRLTARGRNAYERAIAVIGWPDADALRARIPARGAEA